ncbi:unnamed protein product [Amoebophrya sp. A120]|nr:unnamed protein product [Amoebophrya sp. A120]|eukprot:GSA120T00000948001.1
MAGVAVTRTATAELVTTTPPPTVETSAAGIAGGSSSDDSSSLLSIILAAVGGVLLIGGVAAFVLRKKGGNSSNNLDSADQMEKGNAQKAEGEALLDEGDDSSNKVLSRLGTVGNFNSAMPEAHETKTEAVRAASPFRRLGTVGNTDSVMAAMPTHRPIWKRLSTMAFAERALEKSENNSKAEEEQQTGVASGPLHLPAQTEGEAVDIAANNINLDVETGKDQVNIEQVVQQAAENIPVDLNSVDVLAVVGAKNEAAVHDEHTEHAHAHDTDLLTAPKKKISLMKRKSTTKL